MTKKLLFPKSKASYPKDDSEKFGIKSQKIPLDEDFEFKDCAESFVQKLSVTSRILAKEVKRRKLCSGDFLQSPKGDFSLAKSLQRHECGAQKA